MLNKFLKVLRRSLRDANLVMIGAALTIAVASVASVDTFTDRVRRAINQQANALLAGDLAIVSSQELPERYTLTARKLALMTADITSMRSVVSHGDQLQLVELKAVSEGYPLRGQVITSRREVREANTTIPAPGTVWVERRLLDLLGLGEGDAITIGALDVVISRTLLIEPDRAGSLFNLAPRVLLNKIDLAGTNLILPGSRVTNTLLLSGEEQQLKTFRENLTLRDTDRLKTPDEARPEVRSAIERADHFLNLAALTAIVLASVAIALAARAYTDKNTKSCALLRVLGATRRQVFRYYAVELGVLALASISLGVIVGLAAQYGLASVVSGWVQGDLPAARFTGIIRASFIGLVALFGFALPYLLELPKTPPALVLRPTMQPSRPALRMLGIFSFVAMILVAPWHGGSMRVTGFAIVGIVTSLVLLGIVGHVLIHLLYRNRARLSFLWRFGVINLWRRSMLTQIQISGLGLGLTILFTLGLIRTEIVANWVNQLPPGAPNQFLINIQPSELDDLAGFFTEHGLPTPDFYPMIRARLTKVNDKPIDLDGFADPRAKRLANREFNLSWAEELKADNKIVSGQWWGSNAASQEFSFEKDIAGTLGLVVGDVVEYATAGEKLVGRISSLRTVQWDSMGVNFFVEGTPSLLQRFPATYITSFHLSSESSHILSRLVRQFPSISVIDVSALVGQVRSIMQRASNAVEFVAVFTLLAGILVLISATQTTQKERTFNTAMLKTLGSSQKYIVALMASEFILVGTIAGVTSAVAAQICTWLIATQILGLTYEFNFWLVPLGAMIATGIVTLLGFFAIQIAFRKPSRELLSAA